MASIKRFNSVFISHGAPNLILKNDETKEFLKNLSKDHFNSVLPKAVLMISAHWEEHEFTIQTNPKPDIIYDFGGFEKEMYQMKYPAPTSPELIERVGQLFSNAGVILKQDKTRGFDHGAWSPLKLIYPDANVPIVQLSLKSNLNAADHFKMGEILRPLRDEGYLVLSSGGSVHNLRALFDQSYSLDPSWAVGFENWLKSTLCDKVGDERKKEILKYESLQYTKMAHPRTEHLIPLFVSIGCSDPKSKGIRIHESWKTPVFSVSSFLFDDNQQVVA